MNQKKLLVSGLLVFFFSFLQAQYLEPRFKDEEVSIKVVYSSMYLHHTPSTQTIGQNVQTTDGWEDFLLEATNQADWWRIRHVASGKYMTIINQNSYAVHMNDYDNSNNGDGQKFQFVQQTQSGRYKIHTKYQYAGVDLLLQVDKTFSVGALIYTAPNGTSGTDDNQRFDLTLLDPDPNPGSAIGSLADRFEGKKVGITVKFNGWELLGSTNHTRVYEQSPTPGITADEEWVIEYTDETGWYKIRNRLQNKYITVTTAVDGALLNLMTDAAYPDDYQKFKFVVQPEGDDTYKIHSKYSVGGPTSKALVLDVPTSNTVDIRLRENRPTYGSNQKFILTRDLPPPAKFTTGAPAAGNEKILGRQYHLCSLESLALLEPYIVGADTFVRLQQNPNYADQSQWTFDDGGKLYKGSGKHIRIRYGKTGQYLYVPLTDSNAHLVSGMKLQLKTCRDTVENRRNMFKVDEENAVNGSFFLKSRVGPNVHDIEGQLSINEDDFLITEPLNPKPYKADRRFLINLSVPSDSTGFFGIVQKAKAWCLGDSGLISVNPSRANLMQNEYADQSCYWRFIPTGDGYYYIKNILTLRYIKQRNITDHFTTSATLAGDSTKFQLLPTDNFYRIRCKTGAYFYADADPNEVVLSVNYFDNLGDKQKWVITRLDYTREPSFGAGQIAIGGLLSNYSPRAVNCSNNNVEKDKLIRNLGLPFEPSIAVAVYGDSLAAQKFRDEGIDSVNKPNFYAVVRKALAWKFRWNTLQIDSAIKNYRFDSIGHRVQALAALRNYILDTMPTVGRNYWSHDEKELITWVERKIRMLRASYANRIQESWDDYKYIYKTDEPTFSGLFELGQNLNDPNGWRSPDYYIPTARQGLSYAEFAVGCDAFKYQNPGILGQAIGVPAAVGGGLIGAVSLWAGVYAQKATLAASVASKINQAEQAVEEGAELGMRLGATTGGRAAALGAKTAAEFLQMGTGISVVATIATFLEILITVIVEDVKWETFNHAVNRKVDQLINRPYPIDSLMQSNSLLTRSGVIQDVDYVLAAGERFDTIDPLGDELDQYVFDGNGNWNDGANWGNLKVPPYPLPANRAIAITIKPMTSGVCNINVPAELPQHSIFIAPHKKVNIQSTVTIK